LSEVVETLNPKKGRPITRSTLLRRPPQATYRASGLVRWRIAAGRSSNVSSVRDGDWKAVAMAKPDQAATVGGRSVATDALSKPRFSARTIAAAKAVLPEHVAMKS